MAAMATAMDEAGAPDDAGDDLGCWLAQAFEAERAPLPCRLPAPKRVAEVAKPRGPAPAVRGSFVLMLALSATALLLQP